MPFLPKIPKPFDGYAFIDDVKKVITHQMLEDYFLRNHQYLEDMLARYNPRVVIVDEKAWGVINKKYNIDNHILKMAGGEYPLFSKSEVKQHRKEIEQLATLPYRGTVFPHIISIEEMKRIVDEHHD